MSIHLMYLGEISPRKLRGIVTLTSATFTSLGKLSGQFFGLRYALTANMYEMTTVVLIILEDKRAQCALDVQNAGDTILS